MIVKKLIMVTPENNNKFYNMFDEGGDTFKTEWGRVSATPNITIYPKHRWNSIYNDKIRKGYKDVTDLAEEIPDSVSKEVDIADPIIKKFVNELVKKSNKLASDNYNVSITNVTETQLLKAQEILDNIINADHFLSLRELNDRLVELFVVIPRKMKNVKEHLLPDTILLKNKGKHDGITFSDDGREFFYKEMSRQQDILDSLKTQVKTYHSSKKDASKNILEYSNLSIGQLSSKDTQTILQNLGELKNMFKRGFTVVNNITQKDFNSVLKTVPIKNTKLLWHGSRTENWWSIITNGLLIRPVNVVTTGNMFGHGIYFADRSKKSFGYTSYKNSYWARGNAPVAYMALFEVLLGNVYETYNSLSDMSFTNLRKKGDYHSVFAKAGKSLYNNEFIVYDKRQCTSRYIVELGD